MKKTFISILLAVCFIFTFMLTACNNSGGDNPPVTPPEESKVNIDDNFTVTSNILVVYFSKTNTTENVALKIQELTNGDIFEVERKEPYPNEYTPTTEVAKDEKDNNARPELKTYLSKEIMESYDTIFVGFPIWWHTAPMPILSFLNFYDFSGKTIYTFCTSGGSPITESTADIRSNAQGAKVIEGEKFSRNDNGIESWINSLNLAYKPVDPINPIEPVDPTMSLTYEKNGNEYTVTGIRGDDKNIVIPEEYEGLPVTEIGNDAFAYSRHTSEILSVVIPDSVVTIGRNAFYNRSDLTSITIGENSALTAINNNAFAGNSSLKSIYLPKGLERLGSANSLGDPSSVFNGCGSLDYITVAAENPVFSSEGNALINKITNTLIRATNNTEIPASVTTLGERSFSDLNAMTELIIPVTITSIASYVISWRTTSITTVRYLGTEEQWNNIIKGQSWDSDNEDYELKFGNDTPSILIAYFSWSETTTRLAQHVQFQLPDATIYRIERETPYSDDYQTVAYGEAKDEADSNARPPIKNPISASEMSNYDIIIIMYPIWWHTAPMVVGTFLETYDLSGKDIYAITQSASMDAAQFNQSFEFIKTCATKNGKANVHEGLGTKSTSTIENYLRQYGLIV